MGDVIHALPAAASLKHGLPGSVVDWAIEERWLPLLEGNPYIDRVIPIDRKTLRGIRRGWSDLRSAPYDLAVDFQGLIKSALIAAIARPERIFGFDQTRERPAAWFYSRRVRPHTAHVVDQNLELVAAAGVSNPLRQFPLPEGRLEGSLPDAPFVLASPLAGWGAKQWPLEHYTALGAMLKRDLGLALVLNAPKKISLPDIVPHVSGIPGLIYATRRAAAVVGLDSGPLHLAAALGRPGVGIYGPTDPARNGPYGNTIAVLRAPGAVTTYRRLREPGADMRSISPEMVLKALRERLAQSRTGENS
jgi:heptosyltransferase-1